MFSATEPLAIALLTVIDVGPRRDIDRMRERFGRPPMQHQPLTEEMMAAEEGAAKRPCMPDWARKECGNAAAARATGTGNC